MVGIRGAPKWRDQLAPKARLLLDLAQRGFLEGFAAVNLSLGERPVIVARAVDDGDAHRTTRPIPADDASRGPYEFCLIDVQDLCCHGHPLRGMLL